MGIRRGMEEILVTNGHEADLDFAKEFAHKINNFDKI